MMKQILLCAALAPIILGATFSIAPAESGQYEPRVKQLAEGEAFYYSMFDEYDFVRRADGTVLGPDCHGLKAHEFRAILQGLDPVVLFERKAAIRAAKKAADDRVESDLLNRADIPDRFLYLHYAGRQQVAIDQPLTLRLAIAKNDIDISNVQVRLSWPQLRGTYGTEDMSAAGTWASDNDVTIVSVGGTDPDVMDNARRDLTTTDLAGSTSFSSGDIMEFTITPNENMSMTGPFTIDMKAYTQTTVLGQDPIVELPVRYIHGIHVIPGEDPFQLVASQLIGQTDSIDDEFKDSNFDDIIDAADLIRFR